MFEIKVFNLTIVSFEGVTINFSGWRKPRTASSRRAAIETPLTTQIELQWTIRHPLTGEVIPVKNPPARLVARVMDHLLEECAGKKGGM